MIVAGLICGATISSAAPELVFDAESGVVIYAEEPDSLWHPASLTKLMTAYLTFEALRAGRLALDAAIPATPHAQSQEPSKMGYGIETKATVSQLLKALIVKSANDAAVMLGQAIGAGLVRYTQAGGCVVAERATRAPLPGAVACLAASSVDGGGAACRTPSRTSVAPPPIVVPAHGLGAARLDAAETAREGCWLAAFVARMNATAKRLGMTRTRFVNPNGLPDDRQVTTARDMALLARALIREFPEHRSLFALKSFRAGRGRIRSYNDMLRTYEGADGMKTGFICASGYNIVVSATREKRRLVAVVLGARSPGERAARARKLLDYGFEIVAWKKALGAPDLEHLARSPVAASHAPDIRRRVRSRQCGYRPRLRRRRAPALARRRALQRKPKVAARGVRAPLQQSSQRRNSRQKNLRRNRDK